MSLLHQRVNEYLALRRAMGFKLREHGLLLPRFADFVEQSGATTVSIDLMLDWATQPTGVDPFRWRSRLSVVRGFARYLRVLDSATQVPPPRLLAYRPSRPTPFLFSDEEVRRLLDATEQLRPPFRAVTYRTVFGLLAVTGLRVGEAIALERRDVDLARRMLTVRQTKFNRSRRLPLLPSVVAALGIYAHERDRSGPPPRAPNFFLSMRGTAFLYTCVRGVFTTLVRRAGIQARSASCRPRLHGLRHSFAVHSLTEWYRNGVDVAARLALLAAWLGHTHPASTYWYLQATPELLGEAARRLESSQVSSS